jgi:voltage-gated potassium channel
LACIGLMIGGIALVGVVTAALASWFVDHVTREDRNEAELSAQVARLAKEVRALRSQLDGLSRGMSVHDPVDIRGGTAAGPQP